MRYDTRYIASSKSFLFILLSRYSIYSFDKFMMVVLTIYVCSTSVQFKINESLIETMRFSLIPWKSTLEQNFMKISFFLSSIKREDYRCTRCFFDQVSKDPSDRISTLIFHVLHMRAILPRSSAVLQSDIVLYIDNIEKKKIPTRLD